MSPPKQSSQGLPNHHQYYRDYPEPVDSSYPSSPIERYSQDVIIGLDNQSHCQTHAHLPPTSSFGFAHHLHANHSQPPVRLQRTASMQSNATGTNRSSLQGSSLDFHNLSQDSGVISPSPHPSSSTFLGSFDRGVNITPSPQIGVKLKSDVGQHCPTHQLGLPFPPGEFGPPPLPPRKVNPAQWMARNPDSPGPNRDWDDLSQLGRNSSSFGSNKSGASSSWRSHLMQRAENQRLSLFGTSGGSSSSDETEDIAHNATIEACYPINRAQLEQWHGSPLTVKPVGVDKPPPPPPRDPRRRLQVIRGPPRPNAARPVSFSFETQENNWINNERTKQNENLSDPRIQPWQRSTSEQNIAPIVMPVNSSPPLPPSHFGDEFDVQPRSRRPVQLQKSLPPKTALDECDRANHFHRSQPSLLNLPPMQNPPAEYWKSPPPMHSINYLMHEKTRMVLSDQSRDASPQRPLRKKQAMSESKKRVMRSQDSALHSSSLVATSCSSMEKCGKSSPSSISSRDSGCSEAKSVSNRESRPLSAVWEKHESNIDKENSPPVKEMSPPRSFAHDPGFSTKNRRSKFREALNELEDVISGIQQDQDLLDRAERRDLPTAHQMLIAQARERFQVPSEENSRLDDDSNEAFSDMDNFMNWNTSSSFENLPSLGGSPAPVRPRSRTPASRRSGVIDKKTDDMLYRVIRSNNRPIPEVGNPISKVNFSYLENTPGLNPATSTNASSVSEFSFYRPEPDTHVDDVQYRKIRHANSSTITDPQSKFGIPKEEVLPCSERDYLHAVPNDKKYRSTFNAMRNPDVVKDDLAFRNLRKDSNLSEPSALGIVKDPNVDENVHSCWLHRRLESEYKDQVDPNEMAPYVFYPKKNQTLLKALSEHIAQVIRKQSHSSSAQGDPNEVVFSYEDLRDPEIMKAVKQSLDIQESEEDILREEQEKLEWKGKNVFDLLTANIDEILQRKRLKNQNQHNPSHPTKGDHHPEQSNEASPTGNIDMPEESSGSVQMPDVIVQHCMLEHSPAVHACFQTKMGDFPKEDGDQSKSTDEHLSDLPLSSRLTSLKNSKEPPKLKLLSLIENMRESEREMERAASLSDDLTQESDKLEQNLPDPNTPQLGEDSVSRGPHEEDEEDNDPSIDEGNQASALF
ncbi:hypothetical protein TCAL_17191 [Tigriopus californicus]|uniref:Uncharacterized protein n=1 Tax=Tigriopus californicus TaxID=6832 RepID=A0A553N6N2_TIGCA|nr:hypothetical protein TCAL_17191 [Tigriopus californicus]